MGPSYHCWSQHFALIWWCLDAGSWLIAALCSYLVVCGSCIITDHSTLLLFGLVISTGEVFGVKWHQLECLFSHSFADLNFTVFDMLILQHVHFTVFLAESRTRCSKNSEKVSEQVKPTAHVTRRFVCGKRELCDLKCLELVR